MRKLMLLTFIAVLFAIPTQAADKHQSYFTYEDGGTVVRQPDDDRDVEARVNLPVYPGDEIITNRRGRAEIRLSDGNVIALDRATALRFESILDSYEGDSDETIAELRYGKAIVYRREDGSDAFRIDTPNATYFASREAIFSVEADANGHDSVSVFDGNIEVRTPSRTTRLREGEQAQVDDRGLYDYASGVHNSADDFERWFLRRAERYGNPSSRYLDSSLAYYEDDLNSHGSWTYISGYGYGWRPTVSVGWRPYYNGYWSRGRFGSLTWVSYEPWGWVPYHYGRWAYDSFYGWFWLPGAGYAPAWVYWMYGPGYIGWAPAGWYDCYRPYYNWAYRPYHRAGLTFGFGFSGRVRINEVDLRPWTFIDANTIHSNRVDRAALTTDAVRNRILRDNDGVASISGDPARFTREEFRDPAAAINRRWKDVQGNAGVRSPSTAPDMTPFFRRDTDVPATVRDRVVRTRGGDGTAAAATQRPSGGTSGNVSRGLVPTEGSTPAATDRVNRGGATRDDAGAGRVSRGGVDTTRDGDAGRVNRGGSTPADSGSSGRVNRGGETRGESGAAGRVNRSPESSQPPSGRRNEEATTTWRDRVSRQVAPSTPNDPAARTAEPSVRTPEPSAAPDTSWRRRVSRDAAPSRDGESASPRAAETPSADRGSDVPRRVIDRIGGARVYRGGDDDRPSTRSGSGSRGRESAPPPSVERRSSGGSRDSSPPPRSVDRPSSSPSRSSDGGGAQRDSGGGSSRSGGGGEGRVKRDRD